MAEKVSIKGMRENLVSRQHNERYMLKLLESVITNTSDPVMIAQSTPENELDFRILYVNPAFTEMTGHALAELRDKGLPTLNGFESVQNNLDGIRQAVIEKRSLHAETLYYENGGRQYVISVSLHPVIDTDGRLTHWVAIGRDVTEKRRYLNEIEERNRIFAGNRLDAIACDPGPRWRG